MEIEEEDSEQTSSYDAREVHLERIASLTKDLVPVAVEPSLPEVDKILEYDDDGAVTMEEVDEDKDSKSPLDVELFKSCRVFLHREVPRESLTFVIRLCFRIVLPSIYYVISNNLYTGVLEDLCRGTL